MEEFLINLTATLLVMAAVTWITPDWLKTVMEWILCAFVIIWFFPNAILN